MKIGYSSDDYATRRNIIDIVGDAQYFKLHNINKYLSDTRFVRWFARKILRTNSFDLSTSFTELFNSHGADLIHFFNTISFGTTPWITTFETIVPRLKITLTCHHGRDCDYSSLKAEPKILKALDALSGDSCKKLIALSECNLGMQVDFLRHFPDYHSEIKRKLTYLHPPQNLLVDEYGRKQLPLEGEIRFMFVGRQFFTKGGLELLESFQEVRKNRGYELKLIIISSMDVDENDFKLFFATKEKVERAKKIIHENRDWIEYWDGLGNDKVLSLMKGAHIGLLPTYADTYGYSVLEFQAAGCPVISTNVRALPEINNNETGWVIEVAKNRLGEAIYTTEEDSAEISSAIKKGLTCAITEIMDNRELIYRKANASIERIKIKHSPKEFARKLGEIYHCSLDRDFHS